MFRLMRETSNLVKVADRRSYNVLRTVSRPWLWTLALSAVALSADHGHAQLESRHFVPLLENYGGVAGISAETYMLLVNHQQEQQTSVRFDAHAPEADAWHVRVGSLPPRSAAGTGLHTETAPRRTYSAVITADGPISSSSRLWSYGTSSGVVAFGNAAPAHDLIVPVAVRRFYGGSSILVVQHAEPGPSGAATVEVELRRNGADDVAQLHTVTVEPAKAAVLELDDPEFDALGDGFLGSARIRSSERLAAYALVKLDGPLTALYGYEALPAESASAELFVPLFRAEQRLRPGDPNSSRIDTGIAIYNPGVDSVRASIEYHGAEHPAASPDCRGRTVASPERLISASAAQVYYQGDPAAENLPTGCFGSAVIRASGPVVAIANEAIDGGVQAAAFAVGGADSGAVDIAYLYANGHVGSVTGVAVQNVSDTEATVTVTYTENGAISPVDCGAPCTMRVAPNMSGFFWPPAQAGVPSGFGTAWLESTVPVVAIVNHVFLGGDTDMSTYGGNVVR
jgi:hypothetical protein